MRAKVTVVLVARRAGDYLEQTLTALAAQTRRPDKIVLVELGSDPRTGALQQATGVERIVAPDSLSFGEAVQSATRLIASPESDDQWLWLLSADNTPAPDALAALLGEVEISPSVAVAAPKQMQAADPGYLYAFGETMTRAGTAVELAEPELDQAQYDRESDVLGAAAGGLLVRHRLWEQLGGFDPGLPAVDDSLDFCIRARLSGYRVVLVPGARVLSAGRHAPGTAVLGARTSRSAKARLARTAQLHRRMAYAPAATLPLHWLSLVPFALFRAIGQLLGKRPGRVLGEFAAAFAVAFGHGASIAAARRRIARNSPAGWKAIAPLRLPWKEVRRRRALARDELTSSRRSGHFEIGFFGAGLWTVLAAAVVGVVAQLPLFGSPAVAAPGLLPLGALGELWGAVGYGIRSAGAGFVGAADPFSWVLALLGTVTGWAPSTAVLVLYVAALPLAAMGAWFAAARLTRRTGLRVLAAAAWALAPTLLVAMGDGRLGALIAHLLLPWLVFALTSARRSWAASATAGLLAAAVVACSPSLLPALLLVWLIALIVFAVSGRRGRGWHRLLPLPIPAVALFAPLAVQQVLRGTPLAVFADPGVAVPTPGGGASLLDRVSAVLSLLAGQPDAGSAWAWLPSALGLDIPAAVVAIAFALPLLLGAIVAPFLARPLAALAALAVAAVGFATAVLAQHLVVATVAGQAVTVWPGAGVSIYLIGIAAAALIAFDQGVSRPAVLLRGVAGGLAAVAVVVAALPLLVVSATGGGAVGGDQSTVPALVSAEATNDPTIGTLVLAPTETGIAARLERGAGGTLDEQSTLYSTSRTGQLSADDERVAVLAGNLSSRSGYDSATDLDALRVGFVLLAAGADGGVGQRVAAALDANSLFTPVTTTDRGTLWRYVGLDAGLPPASATTLGPVDRGLHYLVLGVQLLILISTLLLALPSGALAERVRPEREIRRGSGRTRRTSHAASPTVAPAAALADAEPAMSPSSPRTSLATAALPGPVPGVTTPAETSTAPAVSEPAETTGRSGEEGPTAELDDEAETLIRTERGEAGMSTAADELVVAQRRSTDGE